MIVNLSLSASAQAAPAAIQAAWQQAANMIGAAIADNITVTLSVTYGGANGSGSGASAGPNSGFFESYQSVFSYLTQHASPGDTTFSFLPNATSVNGQTQVAVWPAQLKLMGIAPPAGNGGIDGSADFGTGVSASLMLGVALHEFTHAMGRIPFGPQPDIMELSRFTSQGNRLFDGGVPASAASYFSLNGGLTKWADFGVHSDPSDNLDGYSFGGDPASPFTPEDPFDQFYDGNTLQYLTPFDLEQMDALGFHLAFNAPAANSADFNGDNSGDILVQNAAGQIEYGQMSGGAFQGWVNVTTMPGWTVVGKGKISGGLDADIVVQSAGGQVSYLNMVNGAFSNMVPVGNIPGYKVVGVADINLDHYADIVIQNTITDEVGYANMHNGVFTNWFSLADPVGWNVPAVGDVNYDGFADIIIQNKITDEVGYGNLKNGVVNNWVSIADPVGWKVVGIGDIAHLGDDDIVLQNKVSAQIIYAKMQNGALGTFVNVGTMPGWNVISVEDVTGDGYDDIVIQNAVTSQIEYANMAGGTFQGWVDVGTNAGFTAHTDGTPGGTPNPGGGPTDLMGTPGRTVDPITLPSLGPLDAGGSFPSDFTPATGGAAADVIVPGVMLTSFADQASASLGLGIGAGPGNSSPADNPHTVPTLSRTT
jgi:hypothetical protein